MDKKTRRKVKDYDDDLLVELIARGEMTNKQIAERVGISPTQVATIILGRSRADLQPRINAAVRSYVFEVRRRQRDEPGWHAERSPSPYSHRQKEYDDDRLVELIAAGNVAHPKIAAEIGIDKSMVSRIARGEARPDLLPRIQALVRGRRDEFERLAAAILQPSLVKQAKIGLEGDDETARKAREYIIDTFRYPPDPAKQAGRTPGPAGDIARRPKLPLRSMTELPPPLFAAVLKVLGGPELTQEDYDNYAAAHKDEPAVLKELSGPERSFAYYEGYAAGHGDGTYTPGDRIDTPDLPGKALAKTEDTPSPDSGDGG